MSRTLRVFARTTRPAVPALLVLALLAAAALPAAAQWKWRDGEGRITASDLPPPRHVPERDILQRPDLGLRATPAPAPASAASDAAAAAPQRAVVDSELEARRRAAEQEAAARKRADEARVAGQRAENCRRARSQLSALQSGQRIARINEQGGREILDDEGRAAEMRRANDLIASECR